MYKKINKISRTIFRSEETLYFEPKDIYIVVDNPMEGKVCFTHKELKYLFGLNPTTKDIEDLLLVKRIFNPCNIEERQPKPVHLYH